MLAATYLRWLIEDEPFDALAIADRLLGGDFLQAAVAPAVGEQGMRQ
jgi:hypothetical protein